MIRVCDNNHITGFRHCWCGSDIVAPLGNRQGWCFALPRKARDPQSARPTFTARFRQWREAHRAKAAVRK